MTILIFGANGQDGHYLAQHGRAEGMHVVTASRSVGDARLDVGDFGAVEALVRQTRPDLIFHLAANSTTAHAAGFENHTAIATGTLNILESVHRHCRDARVFITGSAVQFENRGHPIHERDPFTASSLYTVARNHSVFAARYYRSLGVRTYVGYLFHHESPYRKPHHVSRMVSDAVARIAAGSDEVIEMGDVSVRKEWTFAGDVARAILCLVRQDRAFEAVIGSGELHSIEEWLSACFSLIGRDWRQHVRTRSGFTAEYNVLQSNPETIRSMGWSPDVGFGALARLMVDASRLRN